MNWRLIILLTAMTIGIVATAAMMYAPVNNELINARRQYQAASTQLRDTTEQRDTLDEQFQQLQTRVDSVEYRARLEYRMIKPGERLLLVRRAE